jgi:drug/metabolite transporter (DMT)-like permease
LINIVHGTDASITSLQSDSMSEPQQTNQTTYISVMILQLCLVSGTYVFAKLGAEEIPVVTLAVFRFIISASVLSLICLLTKKARPIERKDFGLLAFLAFLLIPVNQLFFLFGQRVAATTHGALIYALTPIFIAIFAWVYLREAISRFRLAGIILGVCGALYVIGSSRIEFSSSAFVGDILIVVAMLSWAVFTVAGKPFVTKYGALLSSAAIQTVGIIMVIPLFPYAYSELVNTLKNDGITSVGWLSLSYLAIMTSVIAYLLWYWALARVNAARLGVWMSLQPIVATFYSYLVFGSKELTTNFFIGGAVATVGVVIAQMGAKQKERTVRS